MAIRGWGGLCLDLDGGNTSGGGVQVWMCGASDSVNQKWTVSANGEIKFGSTNKCLTVPSSGTGQVTVTSCSGSSRQRFKFGTSVDVSQQNIVSVAFPTKCLDVEAAWDSDYLSGQTLPINGLRVNIFDCVNQQFNQKFNFSGSLVNGHGFCLDGAQTSGASLFQHTCDGTASQRWDYYLMTTP